MKGCGCILNRTSHNTYAKSAVQYVLFCEFGKCSTTYEGASSLNGSLQLMESQSWLRAPGNER